MSLQKDSNDQVAEQPQITPGGNVTELYPRSVKKEVEIQLEEKMNQLEAKIAEMFAKQVANLKIDTGGNMSDTPSKDWVERKISEVDNKIEMDRIRSDAKFEKLISDSDIKFEKLIGEMNAKFAISESKIIQVESTHIKWMAGLVFSFIAFTLAAIGFSTNLILKAIPSPPVAQQPAPNSPPSTVTESPKK